MKDRKIEFGIINATRKPQTFFCLLLMFAKVKRKCHAGSILFIIQHSARLEQDSSGMTFKYRLRTASNY
jgi:hypothetical protein